MTAATEIVRAEPRGMALLDNARRLLAEARTIDDVKLIRDKAETLRIYAKQQRWCREAQNDVAEIKLRAERRGGELLSEMPKRHGARPDDAGLHDETPSLEDIGVVKTQSHRWQKIATVPENIFEEYIAKVRASPDKELTSAAVFKLAQQHEARKRVPDDPAACDGSTVATLGELVAAGRKFQTVYADPPWRYGNQATRSSTDNHYDTMTVEEICAEPVSELVEDNAHLHLWTTNAFLFDARRVMEAWGFEYKSCFVWVKSQMGIGNYWRVSHEFLLFGLRGKLAFCSRDEKSWAELERGKHSAKPEEMRHKVEKVSPGPYLEMYGRSYTPGTPWTVYGNQVSTTTGRMF